MTSVSDAVTVKTHIVTPSITTTLIDQDSDAVYAVDQVLKLRELFKVLEKVVKEDTTSASAPAAPPKKKGAKHKATKHAVPHPVGVRPDLHQQVEEGLQVLEHRKVGIRLFGAVLFAP